MTRSGGSPAASMARSIQFRPFTGSSDIWVGINIGADGRSRRLEKRSFTSDGDGFLQGCRRHFECHRRLLANLQLQTGLGHRGETRQGYRHLEGTNTRGHPERAGAISNRLEYVARVHVHGHNGDTGQYTARCVRHDATNSRFLSGGSYGEHDQTNNDHQALHRPKVHRHLSPLNSYWTETPVGYATFDSFTTGSCSKTSKDAQHRARELCQRPNRPFSSRGA